MSIPYCYQLRDFTGRIWLPDIEVELDCTTCDAPDFEISVDAVWTTLHPTGRVDLLGKDATPEMRLIGIQIVEDAERDDDLIANVYAREGIAYRGRGGNDADGRMVRTA